MKVIPAVDIKGGKCVQLVGGRPGSERIQLDDPLGAARRWQDEGAQTVHLIDLDAALGSGDNERLIEKIVGGLAVPVQVGGGVRTEEKVSRLFEIGCERVILGTRAVEDREFLSEVAGKYGDGIVVALDAVGNQVLVRGWQEGSGKDPFMLVKELERLPLFGFLYTNVEVEGRLEGIDLAPVKGLIGLSSKPVMVSGGITTVNDLDALRKAGAYAAVVGMAIYTGRIDFKHAAREFR
jgi:phosphoribosylformimino-5-aminoimidazole carboxamide ribotide isomerase